MRSLWLSVLILALVISFCVFATAFSLKGIGDMEGVLAVLEKHEPLDATGALEALHRLFEKNHFLFSVSLPMDDIDALKNALILLQSATEKNDGAAYENALCALRFALYRLRDAAVPSPETVF